MPADAPELPSQPPPFAYPLTNLAARLQLAERPPVKIVALGSSTTAGEGSIVAYPYRLEALLRAKYAPQDRPHPMIDVLNRGIGGEEAPQEFARLESDVVAEQPSLVIWQFGTNSVWQSPDSNPPPPSLEETIAAVRRGVARLRQSCQTDIILIDPQYTPAMLTPEKIAATRAMVDAIARLADEVKVNLFRRFALMERWHDVENVPIALLVDPNDGDHLHDSDWATQLLTRLLMDQIANAVARAGELAS